MAIGVLTSVPWFVAGSSLIQDMESIQRSFLPSLELFYQATGSKVAATFLQSYLSMLYYCISIKSLQILRFPYTNACLACIPGQWITSSRIAWAFARDVSFFFALCF